MSEACVSFTELAFSTWYYNFNLFHQILFICYIAELFTDGLIENAGLDNDGRSLCNARSLCVQRWNLEQNLSRSSFAYYTFPVCLLKLWKLTICY